MNSWISKFKNKIDEFEKISQQEKMDLCTMRKDNLRLCLDEQNRFRLYFKDIEFTKGIGLSTAILSEGEQYTSAAFTVTNIEKPSSDEMILYLAHNQLSFTLKFGA